MADVAGLVALVDEENVARMADTTRKTYLYVQVKYLRYLYEKRFDLLTDSFVAGSAGNLDAEGLPTSAFVREFLKAPVDPNNPPIRFDDFEVKRDFLTFLQEYKNHKGEPATISMCNTQRSALLSLFKDFGRKYTEEDIAALEINFCAKRRKAALQAQEAPDGMPPDLLFLAIRSLPSFPLVFAISSTIFKFLALISFFFFFCSFFVAGVEKVNTGMRPISYGFYLYLCQKFLSCAAGGNDLGCFVFTHCIFTVSWNLICRVGNSSTICLPHMSWVDDALCIIFAHMKNDQMGDRPRDPRHIYANPIVPEICPILALGIYLMVNQIVPGQTHLFPGANQDVRYRKILRRVMTSNEDDIKHRFGLTPDDIGTHSTRKGAATYTSALSTSGPTGASLCLRAGWSLPGVQDTYLRYADAGDQHVGRTVSGLPIQSPEFAILPPHFVFHPGTYSQEHLNTAVLRCFGPHLPANLLNIAPMLLASVVYHCHTGWIQAHLPAIHPLFLNALFTSPSGNMYRVLEQHVICKLPANGDAIPATGIPPITKLLLESRETRTEIAEVRTQVQTELREVRTEVQALSQRFDDNVESIAQRVVARVDHAMEVRAFNQGQLTPQYLTNLMRQEMLPRFIEAVGPRAPGPGQAAAQAAAPVAAPAAVLPAVPAAAAAAAAPAPAPPQQAPAFPMLGPRVPVGWEIPNCNGLAAWRLYCCGDANLPPFRLLNRGELSTSNGRKRFSEFQKLFGALRDELCDLALWPQQLGNQPLRPEQAQDLYMRAPAWTARALREKSVRGRVRRIAESKWQSMVRVYALPLPAVGGGEGEDGEGSAAEVDDDE